MSDKLQFVAPIEREAFTKDISVAALASDARQVSDLPKTPSTFLQVFDLPWERSETFKEPDLYGKSKTCRASGGIAAAEHQPP
jgi:hypothetical protein